MKRYIYGLCGSHGTGKSTILEEIKSAGFIVNQAQLSRAAQKELGWHDLSRAYKTEADMWLLQEAVLHQMQRRDQTIINTRIPTLVERTPADVWAYTTLWCSRLNIDMNDERVLIFKDKCENMAGNYAKFIFVPIIEEVQFIEEKNRADEESRNFIAQSIDYFLYNGSFPTHVLTSRTPKARALETSQIMEQHE